MDTCDNSLELTRTEELSETTPFLFSTFYSTELYEYIRILNSFSGKLNLNLKQLVHFMFSKDSKITPYLKINNEYNEEIIGFPWGITEVNLLEFLNKINKQINLGNIRFYFPVSASKNIDLLISEGLLIKSEIIKYKFEISELSNAIETNENFYGRIARKNDLDRLLQLLSVDKRFLYIFSTKEDVHRYIKEELLEESKTALIFCKNQLISAITPETSKNTEEIELKFYAIRPGYEYSWRSLLINVGKISRAKDWKKKYLTIYLRSMRYYQEFIKLNEEFQPQSRVEGFLFGSNK